MKRIGAILICIILTLQLMLVGTVLAADISGNVEYKPLDMVVIIDTSGSMNYSDSTHMTSSAINMLMKMKNGLYMKLTRGAKKQYIRNFIRKKML